MDSAVTSQAFSTGIAIALTPPIAAVVLAALGRTRESTESEGDQPVLSTPTSFFMAGVGMVLVGVAIHVVLLLTIPDRAQWFHLFGGLFVFGGAYVSWDS